MIDSDKNYAASGFSKKSLELDVKLETSRIVESLRQNVHHKFRRQGAIVGLSGGIDSSVVLALCVKAFDAKRVIGVLLPERESSPESVVLSKFVGAHYGVHTVLEDITAALQGLGCYQRRNEAISRVIPEYSEEWSAKIVLSGNLLEQAALNIFKLTVASPDGREYSKRLPLNEYFQIVAASNFKQRTRMAMLYYHAELNNYAVIGTANKNEHDLGFFVKYGDGGVDVNPITHLYKTQVYQLAKFLGVPEEIQMRTPTTDTYPGGSTQEEFFYRIPFDILDTIWFGFEHGFSNDVIANELGLSAEQVERVVADIIRKKRTTEYLRTIPLGIDDIVSQ